MEDVPARSLLPEYDRSTGQSFRVVQVKRDEYDSGAERLDAQVRRVEAMVGGTAGGAYANACEHGEKGRIDALWTGNPFGHLCRGMKDRRRVGERGPKRWPIQMLEGGEEPSERVRDCHGISARIAARYFPA